MKRIALTALALLCAAAGAACSKDERPAGISSTDNGDTGTSSFADTSEPNADASDSSPVIDSSTSDETAPIDSAVPIDTSVDTDAPIPSSCPKGYTEVPGTAVAYSMSSEDLLAGITWDELTIAWATTSGGKVTVHYADRTSRDGAFGEARELPESLGRVQDKVAFSADGLTLLFVSADGLTLRQLTRISRSVPFDVSSATSAPFARLMGGTSEPGGTAKKLADVVLSRDGRMLWYTDLTKTSGSTVRVSFLLPDGTFDSPNAVATSRLHMDMGSRRRPTGISADGSALFFWDETDESSYVAFRSGSSVEFGAFYAIAPNGKRAMPNDTCNRFYASLTKVLDADAKTNVTQIYRVP